MAETETRNLSGVHRFWRILGIVVIVCLALYKLPALAGRWLFYLISPSFFTFTDPPDFIFAGLIVLTLTALAVRHRRRPYPPGWVKTASAAAVVLAVVAPLVPMVALYLLAYRGQDLIGHWPQPMSDDPKHIGLDDPTYQALYSAVVYGSCFAGAKAENAGDLFLFRPREEDRDHPKGGILGGSHQRQPGLLILPGSSLGDRAEKDGAGRALGDRLLQRLLPAVSRDEVPFVEERLDPRRLELVREALHFRLVGACMAEEDVVEGHVSFRYLARHKLISRQTSRARSVSSLSPAISGLIWGKLSLSGATQAYLVAR